MKDGNYEEFFEYEILSDKAILIQNEEYSPEEIPYSIEKGKLYILDGEFKKIK